MNFHLSPALEIRQFGWKNLHFCPIFGSRNLNSIFFLFENWFLCPYSAHPWLKNSHSFWFVWKVDIWLFFGPISALKLEFFSHFLSKARKKIAFSAHWCSNLVRLWCAYVILELQLLFSIEIGHFFVFFSKDFWV